MTFNEEDAFPRAREEFIRVCGFRPDSEKHKNMLDAATSIRELGVDKIKIRALLAAFEPDVLKDDYIEIDGVRLHCDSVYLMEKEKIHKVLFYMVTVNECGCESEQILDRVYADFWGTAYVDSAFELFKQEITGRYIDNEKQKFELSEAFGPGYYGMPTEEIKTFFKILDGDKIGIRCHESCVMLPIKSCAGLFLVLEEGAKMPEKCCESCVGNKSGCRHCSVRPKGA